MKDERLLVGDLEHLGQVGLGRADVDERIAVVAEDPEAPIEVEVDRRRLEVARVVRLDADAAGGQLGPDVAVGEDAHRVRRPTARGGESSTPAPSASSGVPRVA